MKIISLGGIGGCDLATALRKLNQQTYPYDWLITTQSFIIKSFNNFNNFFIFNNSYVHDKKKLLEINKKAIILHDFINFNTEKQNLISKYKRRFERLNNTLNSNEKILFVRMYDNLDEKLNPLNYYDNILNREEEDINKWSDFIINISNSYNKNIYLLIISSNKQHINYNNAGNIIVY
mgnify:FL=1